MVIFGMSDAVLGRSWLTIVEKGREFREAGGSLVEVGGSPWEFVEMRGYAEFCRVSLGILHSIFPFSINHITLYSIRDIRTGVRILHDGVSAALTHPNATDISRSLELGGKTTSEDLERSI